MSEQKVPEALQIEHEELREELQKAAAAGGKTGEAAQHVLKVLHPHILLEEEFAIPPLCLLPRLARGEVTADMRRALSQSMMLKTQLPRMLEEHKLIVEALRRLMQAAQEEGLAGFARLARKMIVHAQTEEEIFYPASILVGEYLKLKLGQS
jgi:hemerythrin superfamily protein